jgi:hypothetical protein
MNSLGSSGYPIICSIMPFHGAKLCHWWCLLLLCRVRLLNCGKHRELWSQSIVCSDSVRNLCKGEIYGTSRIDAQVICNLCALVTSVYTRQTRSRRKYKTLPSILSPRLHATPLRALLGIKRMLTAESLELTTPAQEDQVLEVFIDRWSLIVVQIAWARQLWAIWMTVWVHSRTMVESSGMSAILQPVAICSFFCLHIHTADYCWFLARVSVSIRSSMKRQRIVRCFHCSHCGRAGRNTKTLNPKP